MTRIQEIIAELEEYNNPDDTHRMIALLKALDEINETLKIVCTHLSD